MIIKQLTLNFSQKFFLFAALFLLNFSGLFSIGNIQVKFFNSANKFSDFNKLLILNYKREFYNPNQQHSLIQNSRKSFTFSSFSKKYQNVNNFSFGDSAQVLESNCKSIIKNKNQKNRIYAEHSVLSSGTWVKFKISKDGIYQLKYDYLENLGFSNPQNVRIYSNGGKMLDKNNEGIYFDDLIEIQTLKRESDMLFYAESAMSWYFDSTKISFVKQRNDYSDCSYIFVTESTEQGKSIESEDHFENEGNIVSTFDDYLLHEVEKINILKSGRTWFGEKFSDTTEYNFQFSISSLLIDSIANLIFSVAARAEQTSKFEISVNDSLIDSIDMQPVSLWNVTSNYASIETSTTSFTPENETITIKIKYKMPEDETTAIGWLDFLQINFRKFLIMNSNQLKFRDTKSVAIGTKSVFIIQNTNSETQVWDISNIFNVKSIQAENNANSTTFCVPTDSLREFIAFNNSDFLLPENPQTIDNQDLHSASNCDFIIISHPDFLSSAFRLAEFHQNHDSLRVYIATTEQVYNEFSSGKPDVTAYRNFLKMFYDKATTKNDKPKYLLLFGDGSFDNKNMTNYNTNYVLTYQSTNSITPVESYVSDDFFGILDDNESGISGELDIGIGRLPVKNQEEAENVVDKIINYYNKNTFGNWRNSITFIADDGDDNLHINQAENLTFSVENSFPEMNIDKIYVDAFEQIETNNGFVVPEGISNLEKRIENGSLIVNYTGHGGVSGLTDESLLDISTINSWTNSEKLPFFITATCEFGRFDEYSLASAGETILLNKNNGGIGILTTTRLVSSGPNSILNLNFFQSLFNDSTHHLRIGDYVKNTKNISGNNTNKLCFTLLGDPAMKLNFPKLKILTDTINGKAVNELLDTLKAGEMVTISGKVCNYQNVTDQNFNGLIYVTVFDQPAIYTTFGTNNCEPYNFKETDRKLFDGIFTVKNGRFSISFCLTKNVNQGIEKGKISYYAIADSITTIDATGFYDNFTISMNESYQNVDNNGPEIDLYLNSYTFLNGGISSTNPLLLADLTDSSGIYSGTFGFGHDIELTIDGNVNEKVVLNDKYQPDIDTYKSGKISFGIQKLEKGYHFLTLKASDIFFNTSEKSIEFIVSESNELFFNSVLCNPNPFSDYTVFCLKNLNYSGTVQLKITIFSLTGQIVREIFKNQQVEDNSVVSIPFDGTSSTGEKLENGFYFYQISVVPAYERAFEYSGKIIKIR